MDQIIENFKKVNVGYMMRNRTIKVLCYADDAILIAENEDDLQRLLYKTKVTAHKLVISKHL